MKPGPRTYQPAGKIDHEQLRKSNPEATRRAVLEYLKTSNQNISEAASIFGINRPVVCGIIKKEKEGDLRDRAAVPRHQPRRTPMAIEDRAIEVKNRTRFGPERLSRYLKQHEGISIPEGTIRHIIRRNKKEIDYQAPFSYLKSQLPDIDDKISFVIPIMLDKVSVQLGSWSGYNVLAQHHNESTLLDSLEDYKLPY